MDGSLWHAYRRLWASGQKDLPDVDVAQAGGWSSLAALKMAYQQPDDETMLRVVTHAAELREMKQGEVQVKRPRDADATAIITSPAS